VVLGGENTERTFKDIKKLGQVGTLPSWVWIVVATLSGLVGIFIGAFIVRRRASREKAV